MEKREKTKVGEEIEKLKRKSVKKGISIER